MFLCPNDAITGILTFITTSFFCLSTTAKSDWLAITSFSLFIPQNFSLIILNQPGQLLNMHMGYCLVCRTCLTLCRCLVVAAFLVASLWSPFVSGFPGYSVSAMLPSSNTTPSILTTFPLFVTILQNLSSTNEILVLFP